MVPSYGASTAQSVFHVFRQRSNPLSSYKAENAVTTDMSISRNNARAKKALAKSNDKSKSSSVSPLSSSGATPQGPALHDRDDTDMVFVSSPKHIENTSSKNTSNAVFTDADIQDIFRPRTNDLTNGRAGFSPNLLSNGSVSPKRNSRTSRESTGSSCSEGHAELGKSNSSSNALSPLPKLLESLSPAERASMTRPQIVAQEILVTERTYVRDLQEVIEGYLIHLLHHGMTDLDIETIFGNLEDIYDFNKNILEELENIEEQRDPVLISQCFLRKAEGFNSLYVQYCTNYPESAAFLAEILKDKEIADFFLERQKALAHTLPIDSYLMKPVQRIMKYHLLFKDIAKHIDLTTPGYEVIQTAAAAMADVAEYINEMKRLHENALRVEEILGSIEALDGLDVFATGRLVLENLFRIHGSRGDKQLYLFEKLLLICKKLDEGNYQFRDGISCSNMMLVESIAKEPLCFQLIRFDNQKVTYTIQAKTLDIKKEWTKQLKRLIIENHSAMIPLTAREAILGTDKNVRESKYNTIPLQDLDEKTHWRRQKQSSVSGKENQQKDRGSLLIGSKRESVLKEESTNSPKKSSLNTKAKDFLDKKDKEKTKPWKLKRNKPRKTTSNTSFEAEVPQREVTSPNSDLIPPTTVVKSRSLESLRDALSSSQNNLIASVEEAEPEESGQSNQATEQIRRLSLLHDLISLDANDEQPANQQTEDEKPKDQPPETPKSIKALRRLHLSKSVYLDLPDDPLKPGDLRRSRPLSLPPEAPYDKQDMETKFYDEEKLKAFEGNAEKQPRTCNDLRKYGLTRTRSFSRKSRGSSSSLAGSSGSVNAVMMHEHEKNLSPRDSENTDDFDQLEKRLSIISDDDKASTSIKNTLRQVSQAFSSHGSEKALNSVGNKSGSSSNLSVDLGAFLSQDLHLKQTASRSKRRSLGSIISETINPEISSLDETKKRAYSTTVINEVSFDVTDEEIPKSERIENRDAMDVVGEESEAPDEESPRTVKERINAYVTKAKESLSADETTATQIVGFRRSSSVSQASTDSQMSSDGLTIANSRAKRPDLLDTTPVSKSVVAQDYSPVETAEMNDLRADGVVETKLVTPVAVDRVTSDSESNQVTSAESDAAAPKRPAAPSSLNYVGSYAASVRRYRKKNVEVKESKSVYDRIRAYTALVSEEKSLQRGKSVDEMLETLDSANLPTSNAYMEQRRKYASIKTMSLDSEPRGSVLANPDVWFDTGTPKKPAAENNTVSKTEKNKPLKSPIDTNESKSLKAAFTLSRIRFKDLENEKLKEENKAETKIKNDSVANHLAKDTKKKAEANTLPRLKSGKSKTKNHDNSTKSKKSVSTSQVASSANNWKNKKSHTINKGSNISEELDWNENISKQFFKEDADLQSSIVVKDKVKEYYKAIIIPGEKEVEDMRDSTMRRSKKKKDKDAAKSNLHRKLSLRNLDVDEKEEMSNLSRSVSCESVQRGTVKQLISLFSIRK